MGYKRAPNVFMIIEDPMGVIDFHTSKEFLRVAGQLRKYNITMFCLTQYRNYLSPSMRANATRYVMTDNNDDELAKLKEFVKGFPNKKRWIEFINRVTRNYGGLLYDRAPRKYYCFRAPAERASYSITFLPEQTHAKRTRTYRMSDEPEGKRPKNR